MTISILIPVLNERALLEGALRQLRQSLSGVAGSWQVVVVDGGSHDGTREMAGELTKHFGWDFLPAKIEKPSVGRTVAAGTKLLIGEMVVILPIDCSLGREALEALRVVSSNGVTCGGFLKRYVPSSPLMRIYQWLQNKIRVQFLRHLVWTNAIFMRRNLVEIPTVGFLEDVLLSDRLRREKGWQLIWKSVVVSTRRYYPNRVLKRILINSLIMSLFRGKLVTDPLRLKQIYSGKS